MKETLTCPFCSNEMKLTKEVRRHIVGKKIYNGLFYFYKCNTCNEQFTSTETDTESLKNFKHKIL